MSGGEHLGATDFWAQRQMRDQPPSQPSQSSKLESPAPSNKVDAEAQALRDLLERRTGKRTVQRHAVDTPPATATTSPAVGTAHELRHALLRHRTGQPQPVTRGKDDGARSEPAVGAVPEPIVAEAVQQLLAQPIARAGSERAVMGASEVLTPQRQLPLKEGEEESLQLQRIRSGRELVQSQLARARQLPDPSSSDDQYPSKQEVEEAEGAMLQLELKRLVQEIDANRAVSPPSLSEANVPGVPEPMQQKLNQV